MIDITLEEAQRILNVIPEGQGTYINDVRGQMFLVINGATFRVLTALQTESVKAPQTPVEKVF